MKFADYRISPDIKKSLAELEFKRPTDIQYKAIPPILKGEDVLAIAQTGTGKTAAFAIPIINLISQKKATAPLTEYNVLYLFLPVNLPYRLLMFLIKLLNIRVLVH